MFVAAIAMLTPNGLFAWFVLDVAHVPDVPSLLSVDASDFMPLAATMTLAAVFLTGLLHWIVRRQILIPLDGLTAAIVRLPSGRTTVIRRSDRLDAASAAAATARETSSPATVAETTSRHRRTALLPDPVQTRPAAREGSSRRLQDTTTRYMQRDTSRIRREVMPIPVIVPLRQSLDMLRHLFGPGRIKLTLNVEERDADPYHLKVAVNPGDLQHVLTNLIANAIEAMPKGGSLTINVYQAMKWVVTEIIDTGVGMTIEETAASFEYFHTTKKGAGVGLSASHHIVTGYRGALTLNSRKGEGTKATVELPLAGAEAAPRRPGPGGGAKRGG